MNINIQKMEFNIYVKIKAPMVTSGSDRFKEGKTLRYERKPSNKIIDIYFIRMSCL